MFLGVSVCMTTYNQEKYIADAIESVLFQKTTFPVQLVIGEDHSTDKTLDICRHFMDLYPSIVINHRIVNLGLARNLSLVWKECKGKYIAILEGDDLWTSPYKLQKQVELMEQHLEYSMCFTRAVARNERIPEYHRTFPPRENSKLSLTITDTIRHNLMANCSVMYRGGIIPELPSWMLDLPYCDLPLHCLHLLCGRSGYIPESMAVYRMSNESCFENKPLVERIRISTKVYESMSKNLPSPYSEQARNTLIMMYIGLVFYDFCKLPIKVKLTGWTIALEELDHLRRVR